MFSVEAQSLVIGWLHSRSTLCIYVGNTNRCTDEQMEIDRDREIFLYLLRLHAVHSTHLFPHSQCMFLETLNCCKLFISGTNVTLSFDCTLADQVARLVACLSGHLIYWINCLHFVSPDLFYSSFRPDNYMTRKVNMPIAYADFS